MQVSSVTKPSTTFIMGEGELVYDVALLIFFERRISTLKSLRRGFKKSYNKRFIIPLCLPVLLVVCIIKPPLKCGSRMLDSSGKRSSRTRHSSAGVKYIGKGKFQESS